MSKRLYMLFQAIYENGLRLNRMKCIFNVTKLTFAVYTLSDKDIHPRARSLVVSDLRLETKGTGSSPAAGYVQR